MRKKYGLGLVVGLQIAVSGTAWAQDDPAGQDEPSAEVIVTGVADRQLLLDARTSTGSRLGLTVQNRRGAGNAAIPSRKYRQYLRLEYRGQQQLWPDGQTAGAAVPGR